MTWFAIPRYGETRPGTCKLCGPTLMRFQYAGPGIYGVVCCRCDGVNAVMNSLTDDEELEL